MADRILPLENVLNFRDYGDYPAAGGKRIKPGRLFRSAHHGRASDTDLETIAGLGIGVVVDLRRPSERRREPSRRHDGFDGLVIESDYGDAEEDDAFWRRVATSDADPEAFHGYLVEYYRIAPYERRLIDPYARYFAALGDGSDSAVLIHCAAGKDRTGILAALTHHLMGVHPDDALADYLLTNDAVSMEQRLPLMRQAIQESRGKAPPDEVLKVIMGVHPDYLNSAMGVIAEQHGGVDGYVRDVLGVDDALREKIEARLLA